MSGYPPSEAPDLSADTVSALYSLYEADLPSLARTGSTGSLESWRGVSEACRRFVDEHSADA